MIRLRKFTGIFAIAVLMLMTASACGGGDAPALVTTTSRVVTTTTAPPLSTTTTASTTTPADEAPTTTGAEEEIVDPLEANEIFYRVVRQESTRDGNRLFLEITPGDYTEVDMENLVVSVYEERDNLYEVHVFDNADAVAALIKTEAERTPEEAELLDRHYLVSLLEGDTIRFQGPFADLEGFRIGS